METIHFIANYPTLFLSVVAFFSLFIGSFLNVVIYRLPRMMEHDWREECRLYLGLKPEVSTEKLGLHLPNSHCPHCKKNIKPWHNIPLISYAFLKGRCAYCHARISGRYPFVEALTAILSVYVACHFGFTMQTMAALLITWILISLSFIDLDHHLLPDQLTLLLVWIGLFFSLFTIFTTMHDAIMGAILGYLLFAAIQWLFKLTTGKIGMGQGDFKLLAGFGACLGWQLLPLIIFLASVSGIIITLIQMAIKQDFKSVPLPFGPYLAIAGWIALLYGHTIMKTYLNLMVQ